jgi:hypothetical protein
LDARVCGAFEVVMHHPNGPLRHYGGIATSSATRSSSSPGVPTPLEGIDDDALMNEAMVEHAEAKGLIAQIQAMQIDDCAG